MPTYKREATEERTSNREDRCDERDALDEHELILGRLVIEITRSAHLGFNVTPIGSGGLPHGWKTMTYPK